MIDRRRFIAASSAATLGSTIASKWSPVAAAMSELTMQLDWFFNVQFSGVFVAEDSGLYQDADLDVTIMPWADGGDVPALVAGKPMTLGCGEQNIILAAQAAGAPIKAVATMFQASPSGLMTHPESGIASLNDLRGKRVGMHIDGVRVMNLVKGVNDIPDDEIEIVEIPYEGKFERVVDGEFAAVQCYVVDEPIGVAAAYGVEPKLIRFSDYGFLSYAQTIIAHDQLLNDQPEMVKAFLAATFAGWNKALADIPAAASLVVDRYAAEGSKYQDLDYQTRSLELIEYYVRLNVGSGGIGVIDPSTWTKAAELMAEYKIIGDAPAAEASLATGFWPEA